jgi:hypothetical protein
MLREDAYPLQHLLLGQPHRLHVAHLDGEKLTDVGQAAAEYRVVCHREWKRIVHVHVWSLFVTVF